MISNLSKVYPSGKVLLDLYLGVIGWAMRGGRGSSALRLHWKAFAWEWAMSALDIWASMVQVALSGPFWKHLVLGKTTTMKILTGCIKPSSGTATLGGFDAITVHFSFLDFFLSECI